MQRIGSIEKDFQKKLEKIISDSGLTKERFEQIAAQVQSNPEVKQRLQKIMID